MHGFSLTFLFTQPYGLRKGGTKQQKDVGAGLSPLRLLISMLACKILFFRDSFFSIVEDRAMYFRFLIFS